MTTREVPRTHLGRDTCVPLSSLQMVRQARRMREDKRRLGNYVRNARVALGYSTLAAWAEHVGISERTLGPLERGEGAGPNSVAEVENKLGWTPGSAQEVARGGEPIHSHPSEPAPEPEPERSDSERLAELHHEITARLAEAEKFMQEMDAVIKKQQRGGA